MFERSIKYIVLLVINVIVLFVLFFQSDTEETGVFDTQFILSLIQERDELQSALTNAEMMIFDLDKSQKALESDISKLTLQRGELNQALLRCEQALSSAQGLAKQHAAKLEVFDNAPNTSANCDTQLAKLKLARQELAATQVLLKQQKAKVKGLEDALASLAEQEQAPDLIQLIEKLERENQQLKADIENPIYLKSVYISGQKCEKPSFDELVCLSEILVRPTFSKAPTSTVKVSVFNQNKREIASATFSSKRAQLYRLPLGRGRELLAGDFSATFEVEGELLRSEGHTIVH